MSLTNDMLNNLEKRRSLTIDRESIFSGIEATASNRSYYTTYVLYVFLALMLSAATINFLHAGLRYLQLRETHPAPEIIKIPVMHFKVPPKIPATHAPSAAVPAHPVPTQNTPSAAKPTVIAAPANPAPVQNTSSAVSPTAMAASGEIPPVKTVAAESIQNQLTQQYQEAMTLISQNQILPAIQKLKYIVGFEPGYQDARTALATLYLQNNQVSHAIQVLTDGLALEPNNLPLTLLFARALVMQGHNQAALLALKNVASNAGNNSAYVDLLASVQESLGNYSEAVSLYQSLLRQDPNNNRWLIGLGTALEHTGQRSAALNAYQKANADGQLPPDLQNYVTNRIHDLGA